MPALTPIDLGIAALLAAGVALAAAALRLLTPGGAVAAFAVGFLVFGFGGVPFAVPLLAFFLSSSLLSHVGAGRKAAGGAAAKSGPRDAVQVLANGAVPAVLAVAAALTLYGRPWMLLYLGALAAVNADTWATEIGALLGRRPRMVTTLRPAPAGTSGAVSLVGLVAAMAGALFVLGAAWAAWPARSLSLMYRIDRPEVLAIAWAGFVAAFADSILGASLQALYRCERCGALGERPVHCSQPARRERGWRWMTNDTVNLIASGLGALFAWLLLSWFAYPI